MSEDRKLTEVVRRTADDIRKVDEIDREELDKIASDYAGARSSKLAAVIGGVVGSAGGIALGMQVAGAAVVVTGPAGMLLGAALAVLMWRGRRYQDRERNIDERQRELATLEQELRSIVRLLQELPPDAPQQTKDELWATHNALVKRYRRTTLALSSGESSVRPLDAEESQAAAQDAIDVTATK